MYICTNNGIHIRGKGKDHRNALELKLHQAPFLCTRRGATHNSSPWTTSHLKTKTFWEIVCINFTIVVVNLWCTLISVIGLQLTGSQFSTEAGNMADFLRCHCNGTTPLQWPTKCTITKMMCDIRLLVLMNECVSSILLMYVLNIKKLNGSMNFMMSQNPGSRVKTVET